MTNSALPSDTPVIVSTPHNSKQFETTLVDESILKQMIIDTSVEVIPILIDHYVQESQRRIAVIKQSAINQDTEALEFELHTLGSTALALGNRPLSDLSRKLERLCIESQCDAAFSQVDDLLALSNRSIQALIDRKNQGFS
ncbi:Hpt domain-containing protein [Vibrio gigantis]|uniref:Hpt domain-containing protein n=1 Tax=Vibrio gigantis TaxID=296199 RepID=A0A5M9N9X8_9VIBR|nr:Hpt domain-containing protein [Vibrio gigantis]KAA8667108.1 Hpt domain-containing protein [Vibrio gigantis]